MSGFGAFGSLRDRPFELFVVARKTGRSFKILTSFPDAPHQIDQKYPMCIRFCFPDRPEPKQGDPPMKALRFTFVLTNEVGRRLYGHVLHPLSGDMMCFISKHCWIEFFDHVFFRYRMDGEDVATVIAFYNALVPGSHAVFTSPTPQQMQMTSYRSSAALVPGASSANAAAAAAAAAAASSTLPRSIAEGLRRPNDSGNAFADVRLSSVLEFLSNDSLLRALAALMCEARILVVGRHVADISDVVLGLVALLQPFDWEHVLIPVVPNDLLDVLCSPTPFLIGLLTTQLAEASRLPMEDVTVIVLGRTGGDGSFVRKGVTARLEHHESLAPASPSHPLAMSTRKESMRGSTVAEAAVAAATQQQQPRPTENDDEEEEEYDPYDTPILTLPFTDSTFSSVRVGLYQARRRFAEALAAGSTAWGGSELRQQADEELLATFHDYYVFTFGLVFAQDFTPQNYCLRMVMRTGGDASSASPPASPATTTGSGAAAAAASSAPSHARTAAEVNAKEFFDRVSQGMMLADMRATLTERLRAADRRAVDIKRNHLAAQIELHTGDFSGRAATHHRRASSVLTPVPTASASASAAPSPPSAMNANGDTAPPSPSPQHHQPQPPQQHSANTSFAPPPGYSFKATSSDVYQIRRIIASEFLEAVLERYPLLYPNAAQILAHGAEQEAEEAAYYVSSSRARGGSVGAAAAASSEDDGVSPANTSRTVSRLEDSSLLRRFVSWCSYGVTSTVQKLETRGKGLMQQRAELEEL